MLLRADSTSTGVPANATCASGGERVDSPGRDGSTSGVTPALLGGAIGAILAAILLFDVLAV